MHKQKCIFIWFFICLFGMFFGLPESALASLKSEELFHYQSINQERAKNNQPALELSDCLSYGARQHSYWMATTGNIVHSNTSRGDVALNGCGVAIAGSENIVYNWDEYATFNWLLNSSVHKQNMNSPFHKMVGIGSYKHTDGRLYVTQYYVNCSVSSCDSLRTTNPGMVAPEDFSGPGSQPLAMVSVLSPTNNMTIETESVDLTLRISPNYYPGLLDQDFVIEVSVCKNRLECATNTTDSAPFRFVNISDPVTTKVSRVSLPYIGKNYLTNFRCAIRSINSGAKAPCISNSYDGSYVNRETAQHHIHRFYSPLVKHHLFTIDTQEAISIQNNFPSSVWTYEGSPFRVKGVTNCSIGETVYRFYSEVLKGHLYTTDDNEKAYIIQNFPQTVWRYEGIAYCADKVQAPGSIPVYRFYSEVLKGHLYTTDETEKQTLINYNDPTAWRYEGVAYYAYST